MLYLKQCDIATLLMPTEADYREFVHQFDAECAKIAFPKRLKTTKMTDEDVLSIGNQIIDKHIEAFKNPAGGEK